LVSEETGLDAWFIHEKLVLNLLTPAEGEELARRVSASSSQPLAEARRADLLERAVARHLATQPVEALDVLVMHGTVAPGKLIWFEQGIAFKGLQIALKSIANGEDTRATFSAKLQSAPDVRIHGDYNPTRLTCSTAKGQLSGTHRQFVVGYVQDATVEAIEIRPIVIASRWAQPSPEIEDYYPVEACYLSPGAVDQFAAVDFSLPMTKADLNVLKNIPEAVVKTAFAEILGEPDVPKDWGGEQFDLWTTRLSVEGQQLRAAFLFKGPAEFKPMTISSLGKNGDQIDRLSSTAADVLVIQHCHSITAPVVNMARVYASDPRHPRRYLTIDGYDTIKILRHFKYID
jgi:hypothetical protein